MEKGGTRLWKNVWLQRKESPASRQPEIIDHTSGSNQNKSAEQALPPHFRRAPPHFRRASPSSAARLTQRRSSDQTEPLGGGSGLCGDADLLSRLNTRPPHHVPRL